MAGSDIELTSISSHNGAVQNHDSASDDNNDINIELSQKLLSAVEDQNVEHLKHLLQSIESDVSEQLNHVYATPILGTLLHTAAKGNMHEVTRVLVDKGADPNIK
ncbi:unnamed protein product, partial [Meganyctiphanes norvegica]